MTLFSYWELEISRNFVIYRNEISMAKYIEIKPN